MNPSADAPESEKGASEDASRIIAELAERIRQLCSENPELDATEEPAVLGLYLADRFVYDMVKGGFAQFVFNMKGNYLQEVEQILLAADAEKLHGFYVQAIEACFDDTDTYFAFIDGDYISENALKDRLQALSLKYLLGGGDPALELASFVRKAGPQAEVWLGLHGG